MRGSSNATWANQRQRQPATRKARPTSARSHPLQHRQQLRSSSPPSYMDPTAGSRRRGMAASVGGGRRSRGGIDGNRDNSAARMTSGASVASQPQPRPRHPYAVDPRSERRKRRPVSAKARLSSPGPAGQSQYAQQVGGARQVYRRPEAHSAVSETMQGVNADGSLVTEFTRQTVATGHRSNPSNGRPQSAVQQALHGSIEASQLRVAIPGQDGDLGKRPGRGVSPGGQVYQTSPVQIERRNRRSTVATSLGKGLFENILDPDDPESLREKLEQCHIEISRLKQEVIHLTTEKARLADEVSKRDKSLSSLLEGTQSRMERNKIAKDHERNLIIRRLKDDIAELKVTIADRDAELTVFKRSHRSTSLLEMTNAQEEYYNETIRLKKLLQSGAKPTDDAEHIRKVVELQEQVDGLKEALEISHADAHHREKALKQDTEMLKGVIWAQQHRIDDIRNSQRGRQISRSPIRSKAHTDGEEIIRNIRKNQHKQQALLNEKYHQRPPRGNRNIKQRRTKKKKPSHKDFGDTTGTATKDTFSSMGRKLPRRSDNYTQNMGRGVGVGGHVRQISHLRNQAGTTNHQPHMRRQSSPDSVRSSEADEAAVALRSLYQPDDGSGIQNDPDHRQRVQQYQEADYHSMPAMDQDAIRDGATSRTGIPDPVALKQAYRRHHSEHTSAENYPHRIEEEQHETDGQSSEVPLADRQRISELTQQKHVSDTDFFANKTVRATHYGSASTLEHVEKSDSKLLSKAVIAERLEQTVQATHQTKNNSQENAGDESEEHLSSNMHTNGQQTVESTHLEPQEDQTPTSTDSLNNIGVGKDESQANADPPLPEKKPDDVLSNFSEKENQNGKVNDDDDNKSEPNEAPINQDKDVDGQADEPAKHSEGEDKIKPVADVPSETQEYYTLNQPGNASVVSKEASDSGSKTEDSDSDAETADQDDATEDSDLPDTFGDYASDFS